MHGETPGLFFSNRAHFVAGGVVSTDRCGVQVAGVGFDPGISLNLDTALPCGLKRSFLRIFSTVTGGRRSRIHRAVATACHIGAIRADAQAGRTT